MARATSSTESRPGAGAVAMGCVRRRCTGACNEGSRRFLRLTSVEPVASGPMPERRTILVADDSSANRDLLSGQLSTLGFWTEAATNGQEAVAAARRLQ